MNARRIACCLLALAAGPLHAAVEVAPNGKYEGTLCLAGPVPAVVQSDKEMAGSFDVIGPIVTHPGTLYHLTNIRCLGAWSVIDGQYRENGYCQVVDNDGDRMLGKFTRVNGDGRWDVVSGTGKYAGITSGGPYSPVGQFPQPVAGTLQSCSRISGTWKLR